MLSFTISPTLEEALTAAKSGTFYGSVQTKKICECGLQCMKQIVKGLGILGSIQGIAENYCTFGKIQLDLLFTSAYGPR